MTAKVAVVTGSNKGIGLAIVKGLCRKFQGDVYLTARDVSKGKAAVKCLETIGLNPLFHQLDVTDPESVKRLRNSLMEKYKGLDVLVNNAGVGFSSESTLNMSEQAKQITSVNYFSLVSTCNILYPILKPKARVVHLSSSYGHLSKLSSEDLRRRFGDKELTENSLSELVREYVASVKKCAPVDESEEWGSYIISKVAVSALTIIQNRECSHKDISINCVHPGYINTDLTEHRGPLTVEEGAVAPLYLALEASDSIKGAYIWKDKTIVDWYGTIPADVKLN